MRSAGLPPPQKEERRPGRRVNALLTAYYAIDGKDENQPEKEAVVTKDLDRQGFDAKLYFDGMIMSGKLPDLVKRSDELDVEVKDLDSKMQKLVYENYSQFTRAAGVISRMKMCMEALEPDIERLEGKIGRMTEFENRAESGVASRSERLQVCLKRQDQCRKLVVLFELPATLKRCLEKQAYESAVSQYNRCIGFLDRHRSMPTFVSIYEDVQRQIGLVKNVLRQHLKSGETPVDVAVRHAQSLVDLGEVPVEVIQDYFVGRSLALRETLDKCFYDEPGFGPGWSNSSSSSCKMNGSPNSSPDDGDSRNGLAEGDAICVVCNAAAKRYMPSIEETVFAIERARGSWRNREDSAAAELAVVALSVGGWLGNLFERISRCIKRRCPSPRSLVTALQEIVDALQCLMGWISNCNSAPSIATFLYTIAAEVVQSLFLGATLTASKSFKQLHDECAKHVSPAENEDEGVSRLEALLETVARKEHAIIIGVFNAFSGCQPLVGLLQDKADAVSVQLLVRDIHRHLGAFFLACAEMCYAYVGQDAYDTWTEFIRTTEFPRLALDVIGVFTDLPWNSVYGLILVRIVRHLEVKVISKVWSVAQDLIGGGAEPPQQVLQVTRSAAQAVISHVVLTCGGELAAMFRTTLLERNWFCAEKPRDVYFLPGVVRLFRILDCELALILGDPRKEQERRHLSLFKTAMELEMERMLSRKIRTFAPTPFNRNGAEVSILRIAFKAMYEHVREVTFSKFGLQQIQVECALLSTFVQGFVETSEDANSLCSLLSEAVTSASHRCVDPHLMDGTLVEAFVRERKKEFRLD